MSKYLSSHDIHSLVRRRVRRTYTTHRNALSGWQASKIGEPQIERLLRELPLIIQEFTRQAGFPPTRAELASICRVHPFQIGNTIAILRSRGVLQAYGFRVARGLRVINGGGRR